MKRLLAFLLLASACGTCPPKDPSGPTAYFSCHEDLNPISYVNLTTGEEFVEFDDAEYGRVQWSSDYGMSQCLPDREYCEPGNPELPRRLYTTARELNRCLELID